ncbi:MAG: hypothetical protein O2850_03070 [Actinomycetota bacterium]|nr:hypothetical protein [Actinomycetota bacterium]
MSDKKTLQDLKETLVALTETFGFLKEQDPKDLKKNKIQIFQVADVELQESRARRVSGSAGVRVAKGVYLGKTSAKSHQELTSLDRGDLQFQSNQLIFTGDLETRTIKLDRIVDVDMFTDAIKINIEGRQKPVYFKNLNSRLWFVFITVFQGLDFSDESWSDVMSDYLSEVAQQTENVNIEYENSAIGKTEDKMYEAIDKVSSFFKRKNKN